MLPCPGGAALTASMPLCRCCPPCCTMRSCRRHCTTSLSAPAFPLANPHDTLAHPTPPSAAPQELKKYSKLTAEADANTAAVAERDRFIRATAGTLGLALPPLPSGPLSQQAVAGFVSALAGRATEVEAGLAQLKAANRCAAVIWGQGGGHSARRVPGGDAAVGCITQTVAL
jgi:hypothetical protein